MGIKIVSGVESARGLEGEVAIIDTFRASNTILAILQKGAKAIYVAQDKQHADTLRERYPDALFFGEHRGIKFDDAYHDNSPSDAYMLDLTAKEAILTTSMGARAILAPVAAERIIVASFGNAAAVAEYVTRTKPSRFTFVACGEIGPDGDDVIAWEDHFAACYIRSLIEGSRPLDYLGITGDILSMSDGAKRLRNAGLTKDLEFCLRLNYTSIIPVARRTEDYAIISTK